MTTKATWAIVVAVGLLMVIVFGGADLVGLGQDLNTFGYKQIIGVVVGALVFLGGMVALVVAGRRR